MRRRREFTRGALVDVRASDRRGVALYRVITPTIALTPFHDGSDKWAQMRRYDWKDRRFLPPRPVQRDRVVRIHTDETNPLNTPIKM